MKKLKLFIQGVVELVIENEVGVNDPEEQADTFLTFMYCSLPATTFEAVAKRLGMSDNQLSQICDKATFKKG